MEYIKVLIILVLLRLIFLKHNTIEKMTDTKIIKESVKNHINDKFNIGEVRKLGEISNYLTGKGAKISKNLIVKGKLILPKDGLLYERQQDGSIKTLDLNNLITHGSDVILKMKDQPLTLGCSDHDQVCCDGRPGKCFYHNTIRTCWNPHLHTPARIPISTYAEEDYGLSRLHVFTLDKKIREIPDNKEHDYQPNYDEPEEEEKEKPKVSTKEFSGAVQEIGTIEFK